MPSWQESFAGGSPEAERKLFERLAKDIMLVQLRVKKRSKRRRIDRAFHAKLAVALTNAKLQLVDDLPEELAIGFAQPGASYPTTVRFSNASGAHQADSERDLRGAALRVRVSESEVHDLLMTNFPASHARDAVQFVAFARAMSGSRVIGIPRLAVAVGPREAYRMLKNVLSGSKRAVRSLALETYWSRSAILWGTAGPVRYLLRPEPGAAAAPEPASHNAAYLRSEFAERLRAGEVAFEICLQRFADEARTPIEDASVEWTESAAPPMMIARLILPQQDIDTAEAAAVEREVNEIAFNPWHTTDEFRPLGNINRSRKAVYQASSAHRLVYRFHTETPWRNRVSTRLATAAFDGINRFLPWHRLPLQLSLLNISLYRHRLRHANLIDTEIREAPPKAQPVPSLVGEDYRTTRSFDGTYNDLSDPRMGAVGAAFGRNIAQRYLPDMVNTPNPIVVSRELLTREHFIPARSLNVLAAAWIQFQVHDWVQHGRYPLGRNDITVPIPGGGTWRNTKDGPAETVMRIAADEPLVAADPSSGRPPVLFANNVSHWWDGSEIYGTDETHARSLRDGACLRLEDGYLPEGMDGAEVTGFNESWWLGLSAMHTLFAREHNSVCDALRREYRDWPDERVYQTARLVVSALIAKIHTVEWTPAILATRAIDVGLKANWYGPPKDRVTRFGLWLTDVHALQGIPKTTPDHHAAPYSLTEEFVTVYRMHPLLPDDYRFYDAGSGRFVEHHTFNDIQGIETDELMRRLRLQNVLYSLGISHPGAIRLHNYPRALQAFERGNGERIDLSVVDLVRERHRGIARYNAFRKGLHKPPIKRWEDLTADPESVRRLRDVYRDIDHVDTMIGLFAETPPAGFGFSDTAFRIFILMATRRLQSDRFLNIDYRPEIYSPLGFDWVEQNGMTSVILRHCPELTALLPREESAFAPWRAASEVPRG